jgi:hypothetical protein
VRLQARLRRLEHRIAFKGSCPVCRDRRGRTALVVQMPEDLSVAEPAVPEPCRACGAVPETILHVIVAEAHSALAVGPTAAAGPRASADGCP